MFFEQDQEFPGDYESCGCCGYDHAYEPAESSEWHQSHGCHKKFCSGTSENECIPIPEDVG